MMDNDFMEQLHEMRRHLLTERNVIFNNPFKYYNPFYRKRLRDIGYEIDNVHEAIVNVLSRGILSAETNLKKKPHNQGSKDQSNAKKKPRKNALKVSHGKKVPVVKRKKPKKG